MGALVNRDGVLGVSGALTFETVPKIFAEAQARDPGQTDTVDLATVSSVDSAGLALMLEWQSNAKARGTLLSFINAPSDLQRLAALSGATDLLGLTSRADTDNE